MFSNQTVTILMPAYNAAKTIAESIACVMAQTHHDWKLLILDDGSNDRTRDIALRFAEQDARILVVPLAHRGLCETLNTGLRMAETELIGRLDADDLCHPTRLEKQIEFLGANPEVKILGTWGQRINDAGEPLAKIYLGPIDVPDYHRHLERKEPIFFIHGSVVGYRDVFLEFGGYGGVSGEDYPGEDIWLWTRIAQKYLVLTYPEELVGYRITQSGISNTSFSLAHEQMARLRYSLEHGRWIGVGEFRQICRKQPIRRLRLLQDRLHRYWFRTGAGYFYNGRRLLGAVYLFASLLLNPSHLVSRAANR